MTGRNRSALMDQAPATRDGVRADRTTDQQETTA